MKRCGIFVFYNEQGVVEPYVTQLLKSTLKVLDKLVIVINGGIAPNEKEKLRPYSQTIFQRSNLGYDGGAYKDVFTIFLKEENWRQWDELLLFNDTFYGPFYPWDEVLNLMAGRNCDFWGLSTHQGGSVVSFNGEVLSPHVQSYFMLIRKHIFNHPAFFPFWEQMAYPSSYQEAVKNFEISFSEYFTGLGFSFESWSEVKVKQQGESELLDLHDMETLITKFRFPVLKRKAYMLQDYISIKRLFLYLTNHVAYPFEMMRLDICKRCLEGKVKPYNPSQLLEFCGQYEEIYLFGMGGHAKNIEQFLADYGKKVNGYLVSKIKEKQDKVYELDDFSIRPNQGIVIALNQEHVMEVEAKLKSRIPSYQVMFPVYDI